MHVRVNMKRLSYKKFHFVGYESDDKMIQTLRQNWVYEDYSDFPPRYHNVYEYVKYLTDTSIYIMKDLKHK